MPEKISKITYRELGDFLISPDFEEIKKPGHTVFRNNESDSLITLPPLPKKQTRRTPPPFNDQSVSDMERHTWRRQF